MNLILVGGIYTHVCIYMWHYLIVGKTHMNNIIVRTLWHCTLPSKDSRIFHKSREAWPPVTLIMMAWRLVVSCNNYGDCIPHSCGLATRDGSFVQLYACLSAHKHTANCHVSLYICATFSADVYSTVDLEHAGPGHIQPAPRGATLTMDSFHARIHCY